MTDQSTAEQQKSKIFVRESTGLVKNVSFLDSITLNLSNMSIGGLLGGLGINLFAVSFVFPALAGVNLVYASVFGFLFSVPQIVLYTMMSRRFPRTGGDYVWVSRNLGGFAGSTLSFMGYTLETGAYLALIVILAVNAIGSVGLSLGRGDFFGIAVPSSVPGANSLEQFVIGAGIFAILIGVNVLKPKAGYKLVSVMTVAGLVTLFLAIGVLLLAGNSGVANFINGLGITDSGKAVTFQSIAASYSGPSFDLGATLFIMPVLFAFVYPWLNAAPAVASEIKGRSALRWNVPISAVVAFGLATSALATLYFVAGQPFVNASMANPLVVFDFGINFWTLAMGVAPNTALAFVIGLGWILWTVSILAYGIIVISRYLFAQSFDRFLPAKVSYVSPRFGSPVIAHSIDLALTIALVGVAAYFFEGAASLFGAIAASMIYFAFIGLAAVVYALRREKGRSRVILTLAGLGNVAVFSGVAWEFFANSGTWGLNTLTYSFIFLSIILGAAIYLGSKEYHKRRGVDISLAYKEIPPE